MLDLPPTASPNSQSLKWGEMVGNSSKNVVAPVGLDSVPRSEEDAPPPGTKGDALQMRTVQMQTVQMQTVADMAANRGFREQYAGKAYIMAVCCLIAWFGLLLCNGIVNALQGREMWSDKVIIAVTSGVTVSVLAAFLGVIRGLFPSSTREKAAKD